MTAPMFLVFVTARSGNAIIGEEQTGSDALRFPANIDSAGGVVVKFSLAGRGIGGTISVKGGVLVSVGILAKERKHQTIVLVLVTKLLELHLIHGDVHFQNLRICVKLGAVQRIPPVYGFCVAASDMFNLLDGFRIGRASLRL